MELTNAEAAYIAGILDGEGSISLVRSFAKRTRGRYVYPLVRVANTDALLIEWLAAKVGLGHKGYKTRLHERCKTVHHIGWASAEAIAVLNATLPYLIIKRSRAELVLSLWRAGEVARDEAGGYFGNGHPLPESLVALREAAIVDLAALNKRGI